jgi:hypothetical protein
MDQPTTAKVPGRDMPRAQRDAAWRQIFRDQTASGLSHSDFCRERSIPFHSYFWYRRRLQAPVAEAARRPERPAIPSRLVPVRVTTTSRSSPDRGSIEVVLASGRCLRVSRGFDEETLLDLLRLLEGAC